MGLKTDQSPLKNIQNQSDVHENQLLASGASESILNFDSSSKSSCKGNGPFPRAALAAVVVIVGPP